MRKLYTECDLRRVGYGHQSCSSHIVRTPSGSLPPSVTDTLAAVSPPDYGSFAPYRRRHAAPTTTDDDDEDDKRRSPLTTEMLSFEMPLSATSPRCSWSHQWRRFRAWLSLEPIILADSIDKYSRVGFPFVFTVLSILYWTIYLQIRPADHDDDFVIVE